MIAQPIPLPERITVFISASDPVSHAGVAAELRGSVVETSDPDLPGAVSLVVADVVDAATLATIRSLKAQGASRIVLLAALVDDKAVLAAVEAGVSGVLRRSQATQKNVLAAVRAAAAGEGSLPPDLLGRLLDQVGQLQRLVLHPRGLTFDGLTEREVNVLKLLAEGYDTSEIGRQLFYSDRTVKNIIHDVTSRLQLRNRTHAVAYAIRQGLI